MRRAKCRISVPHVHKYPTAAAGLEKDPLLASYKGSLPHSQIHILLHGEGGSQVALVVKNPLANARDMRHRFDLWVGNAPKARVRSLGPSPLEKDIATHSSILAWRFPWTEEPSRLQSTGVAKR